MNAQGFKGGSVRAPLRDLEGTALEEVERALESDCRQSGRQSECARSLVN
jgi:hypothetical protein